MTKGDQLRDRHPFDHADAAARRERRRFSIVNWLLAVAGIAMLIAAIAFDARAHDAPSGWTYPLACCSDFDCREVPDAAVLERPEGYVIVATGEVIPMSDRKVRHSPDGRFHWCSTGGRPDGKTICLFVPPRSF